MDPSRLLYSVIFEEIVPRLKVYWPLMMLIAACLLAERVTGFAEMQPEVQKLLAGMVALMALVLHPFYAVAVSDRPLHTFVQLWIKP